MDERYDAGQPESGDDRSGQPAASDSWDALIRDIGAAPPPDAASRRRPAVEHKIEPLEAPPILPEATAGDWNALANELGIAAEPSERLPKSASSTPPTSDGGTARRGDAQPTSAPRASRGPSASKATSTAKESGPRRGQSRAMETSERAAGEEAISPPSEKLGASEVSGLSGDAARSAFEALFSAGSFQALGKYSSPPRQRRDEPPQADVDDASEPEELLDPIVFEEDTDDLADDLLSSTDDDTFAGGGDDDSGTESARNRESQDEGERGSTRRRRSRRRGRGRHRTTPEGQGEGATSNATGPQNRGRSGGRKEGAGRRDREEISEKVADDSDEWADMGGADSDDLPSDQTISSERDGESEDDGQQSPKPARRRRRRSRRRRPGDASTGGEGSDRSPSRAKVDPEVAGDEDLEFDQDEGPPISKRAGEASRGSARYRDSSERDEDDDYGDGGDDQVDPPQNHDGDHDEEEHDEDEHDEDDSGELLGESHRNIPTWADALAVMIDANMQGRKDSPSRSGSSRGGSARGRGRGRGGRGRNRS